MWQAFEDLGKNGGFITLLDTAEGWGVFLKKKSLKLDPEMKLYI